MSSTRCDLTPASSARPMGATTVSGGTHPSRAVSPSRWRCKMLRNSASVVLIRTGADVSHSSLNATASNVFRSDTVIVVSPDASGAGASGADTSGETEGPLACNRAPSRRLRRDLWRLYDALQKLPCRLRRKAKADPFEAALNERATNEPNTSNETLSRRRDIPDQRFGTPFKAATAKHRANGQHDPWPHDVATLEALVFKNV
jgi:hypothetical protein